jgi:hypothetical protein
MEHGRFRRNRFGSFAGSIIVGWAIKVLVVFVLEVLQTDGFVLTSPRILFPTRPRICRTAESV